MSEELQENVTTGASTKVTTQEKTAKEINSVQPNLLQGRRRITMPYTAQELTAQHILAYLPELLANFEANVTESTRCVNYVKGVQDVLNKFRYAQRNKSNNIIVENHAYSMIDFKTSYMYGEPIKYSTADASDCVGQDITLLNKYMRVQKKEAKDMLMGETLYSTGQAIRVVMPSQNGDRCPFEIYDLEASEGFIVYSSKFKKEKLFGAIYSKDITDGSSEIICYTAKKIYTFSNKAGGYVLAETKDNPIGIVNFAHYRTNGLYMGVVDIVKPILDAINMTSSNSMDNIVDFVNSLLAVYNMDMTVDQKRAIDEMNAIILRTTDPNRPADAKYIVNSLDHQQISIFYENLLKIAYDLVGVPRSSTNVTSGGDTGQARLLGGGWSKAKQVAKREEKPLVEAELDMLDIVLAICRKHKDSKIKNLYPEDLNITFNRVAYENIQTSIQALSQLYAMNMPKEIALKIVGVVPDCHEVAEAWETYDSEQKESEELRISSQFDEEINEDKENSTDTDTNVKDK